MSAGTGGGPAVVLIHGYICDRRIWSPVQEHWPTRERLLIPTLGGFGDGPGTVAAGALGPDAHVQQLARLIEKAGTGPVHLVGWSYGATLALLVAVRHPELVASVFAYEAGLSALVSDRHVAQRIAADRSAMAGPALDALASGDLRRAVQEIVDGACAREGTFAGLDPAVRQVLLDNARTVPLMFSGGRAPDPPVATSDVQKISCPVTLSVGEHSRLAYRLVAVEGSKNMATAQLQVIPGATHVAPVTVPQVFRRSVRDHLARTSPEEN